MYRKNIESLLSYKLWSLIVPFLILTTVSCGILNKGGKSKEKGDLSEKMEIAYEQMLVDASRKQLMNDFVGAYELYQEILKISPGCGVCYYEMAKIHIYSEEYIKAQALCEEAVKISPNNTYYRSLNANLYQQNGMLSRAAEEYLVLIDLEPRNMEYYLALSTLYNSLGKEDDAIEILNKGERNFGINEAFSLEKERIYLLAGKQDKAYAEVQKLIDSDPLNIRYLGILAESYVNNGAFSKAEELYRRILEIEPDNGIVHLSMADFYRIKKETDKSYEHLKKAFKSEEVQVDIKIKMLMTFLAYSSASTLVKDQTRELLEILLEVHHGNVKVHTAYADFLIQDKKYNEARKQLQFVVETEKDKYVIWEQLLLLENDLRDYKAMYKESKEVMTYFPNQPLPYLFNGMAAIELNKYEEAISSLNIGKGLAFDNEQMQAQFYTFLADVYNRQKKHEKSDEAFDKLLKINPNDVVALNNYSYYLSLRGEKLEKAVAMMKKVIEKQPNSGTYLDTYAWVLYKKGNYEEAKIQIEKSLQNGGDNSAVILEHYGDILFKLGEKENALDYWNKAAGKGKGSDLLEEKIEKKMLLE